MITLVRKFSIIVQGSDHSVLPVIFIREFECGTVQYCVAHPTTHAQQFIEQEKVTEIYIKEG